MMTDPIDDLHAACVAARTELAARFTALRTLTATRDFAPCPPDWHPTTQTHPHRRLRRRRPAVPPFDPSHRLLTR